LTALAQKPTKFYRIGFLSPGAASGYVRELDAIRSGLRDFGYVEGKNIAIEYRWAEGNPERLAQMAIELVALKVDAIITHAIPGARAALKATSTIPIIMADMLDPIAAGVITSFSRPGGNLTGSTSFQIEIHAKRLQLLKEVVPQIRHVGVLTNALNPAGMALYRKSLEDAARAMKVELQEFPIQEAGELAAAFNSMAKGRMDAVMVGEDPLINTNATVVAALALTHRLPSSGFTNLADAGGLIGYGADRAAVYGRSAYFVDRVFKGAKPGDIPFERATKFELIINMKTAKALGLTIPPSVMVRADRVIQ
jgi:putative ABC transport system substrate-binding protein